MAADTVSTHNLLGWTFRASARTAAHIEWTAAELKRIHPEARLVILQPCYNVGVEASKGTHDKDAVLDYEIRGLSWAAGQAFLRAKGWAAWWRHTGEWAAESRWHFHAISLGYQAPVGIYVPGQVDDYYRHALGLKGQHDSGSDDSWFPPDIGATVFSYKDWLAKQAEPEPAPRVPTIADLIVTLKRLGDRATNPKAKADLLEAVHVLGPIAGGNRVSTPTSLDGVRKALRAKLLTDLTPAQRRRITAAYDLIRGI